MTPLAQVPKEKKSADVYLKKHHHHMTPKGGPFTSLLPSLPRVDDDRVLGVPRACDLEGLEQPVLAVPLVRARVRVRGEG